MGQTLNHGVYLPAEGERNCYSGLASNWNLLDTAIGDIAGKASATHTHGNISNDGKVGTTANVPLITGTGGVVQAGSFGNAANTFCEGNDSRLSDARTPVAHTHTKSDVTDLLNSNFIPSANNSYDLGSSSYQWNKIYSADVVHTSGNETIAGNKKFSLAIELLNGRIYRDAASLTKGTLPSERTYYGITNDFALDSSDSSHRINQCRCWVETNGSNVMEWNLSAWNTTNLAILRLSVAADGSNKTYVIGATTIPEGNAVHDLGSSTYKWKTFNGVNPGALSLPNYNASIAQDISGAMVPDQGGRNIRFTPTMNGWMYVDFNISNATLLSGSQEMLVQVKDSSIANANFAVNFAASIGSSHIFVYLPVLKERSVILEINFTGFSIGKGYVYPCLGNV